MGRSAKGSIFWTIWAPAVLLIACSNQPGQQQGVIVAVHLDASGNAADAMAEKGNVTEARVVQGDPQFAFYGAKAVLQWKYRPTYLRCEAVPVIATVTIFPK
jgi:hypothetical protein